MKSPKRPRQKCGQCNHSLKDHGTLETSCGRCDCQHFVELLIPEDTFICPLCGGGYIKYRPGRIVLCPDCNAKIQFDDGGAVILERGF